MQPMTAWEWMLLICSLAMLPWEWMLLICSLAMLADFAVYFAEKRRKP